MRQLRFYVPLEFKVGQHYNLPESTSHHIAKVLRLNEGADIILFNGNNTEYFAKISEVKKKVVIVSIADSLLCDNESELRIHLLQGVSKGDRMDLVLQKCTELGVASFHPIQTERTNVNLNGDRLVKKISHWQGVVNSACEQSQRNFVPEVSDIKKLPDSLDLFENFVGKKILLNPEGNNSLKGADGDENGEILLLIGPEGGFSNEEVTIAEQKGFKSFRLGPRILRTETAAISVVAILQALAGDLG